jgi:tetratricopeptide (TPR) repeat protein
MKKKGIRPPISDSNRETFRRGRQVIASPLGARNREPGPLLDRFLSVASQVVGNSTDLARRAAAEFLDRAGACPGSGQDREACVLGAVLGDGGIAGLRVAPSPTENTATHAFTERRGSCAAIVTVLVALGDELKIPFTAIVLREHVLLGSATDPGLAYEVLDGGKQVRLSELHRYEPMPPGGPAHVSGADFVPYYLDNLAARLAESGDTAAAESTFREAIHIAPKVARLRYNLGTFLVHRERYKEADHELARAIRLGWKDADAYVNRGVANWKLGKPNDARRDFEKALRLEPGNRDAAANLRQLGAR